MGLSGALLQAFMVIAPSVFGACIVSAPLLFYRASYPGLRVAYIFIGALLGQLWLGPFLQGIDVLGLPFHVILICIFLLAVSIAFYLLRLILKRRATYYSHAKHSLTTLCQFDLRVRRPSRVFFCFGAIVLVLSQLYVASVVPAFSWDGLSLWTRFTKLMAVHMANMQLSDGFSLWWNKHPPSLIYFSGYSSYWNEVVGFEGHGYLQWPFAFFATVGIAVYASRLAANGYLNGLVPFFAIAIMSTPLIENHVLISGYSELFVGVALTTGFFSLFFYLRSRNISFLMLGIIASASCIFFRNTGIFYFCCFCAGLLSVLATANRKAFLVFVAIFTSAVTGVVLFGAAVPGVPGDYGALSIDFAQFKLTFAGYTLTLEPQSIFSVARNQIYSLFLNQSFGVLAVASVFILLPVSFERSTLVSHDVVLFARAIMVFMVVSLGLLIVSQFTSYGYQHATPNNDTGNSRFAVPVMIVVSAGLVLVASALVAELKPVLGKKSEKAS